MIYINLFLAALFLLRRKASCISEQKHKYADLKFKALIHADGLEIPVDITLERRRDTRLGLTGKRATLRMPLGAQPDYVQQQLKNWKSGWKRCLWKNQWCGTLSNGRNIKPETSLPWAPADIISTFNSRTASPIRPNWSAIPFICNCQKGQRRACAEKH